MTDRAGQQGDRPPEDRHRPATPTHDRDVIPLREAARAWFAISLQTFGGPAGQIAVMQHELVERRRWLGQERFLHALSYCMVLPGPEAQQLAIYAGWLLNGTRGGLVAGGLFVLPGSLAILALSAGYVTAGDTALVTALFSGLGAAVIAIVVGAVHRVASRAFSHRALIGVGVAAFIALTVFGVPFPLVVLSAGLAGWALGRSIPHLGRAGSQRATHGPVPLISDEALHLALPTPRRTATVAAVGLTLWAVPIVIVALSAEILGTSVLLDQSLFFSGAAVVTFGGAYAVLAYVAQQAVHVYGWLAPGEMVRGLALAETTPGPLIMVVQFVAFVGAYRDPGNLSPWVAGVTASLLTVWVTFVPCFLFVFLGAPYVERLRSNSQLTSALAGITAAVVGVIANLALYFAVHTLFGDTRLLAAGPLGLSVPIWASWRPDSFVITVVALALILRFRWSPLRTLGGCAVLGLLTLLPH